MIEKTIPLKSGYYLKEMSKSEFFPLFGQHYDRIFGNDHTFFPDKYFSKEEKENSKKLAARMGDPYALYVCVFSETNECVGFSFGFQESGETFYMVCSAVIENHRGTGLYGQMLKHIIDVVSLEGFQIIYGTHCATNNAVIIPKLKAGFVIAKMEVSDMFGAIVHLHYYTNKLRRKVMSYRSGHIRPDDELKKVMGLE